ncbi:MAG: MBL fold metallo-hydrolase [Intrasporangium sp.]|uniref:MBL fold metallo-hydrolase n=1 Tax=Intrasporangium sp. TaxID=1925024 RepID=UPI003F7D6A7A
MSDAAGGAIGSLQFVGTATTVLRLGSFTLLTDPNFLHRGQRAWLGWGLWSKRLTEPALHPRELPTLDAIVLSHLHGDHFDRVARHSLSREQPVVTTPQAAERLGGWGFRTEGLDTWSTHRLTSGDETLTIEAVPAIHARGVLGRLLPPVMGSFIRWRPAAGPERSLYLSGDTLTGDHLDEIAERCGTPEAAVVHLGGTRVLLRTVTMDGRQGLDLLRRVRPGRAVAVHHSDYGVFRSPVADFFGRVQASGLATSVAVPLPGLTVPLWSASA